MSASATDHEPGRAPALSIVLPAHNEEGYLLPAATRLFEGLRERGTPFEVLICENGSTDATAAIADGLSRSVPEVRWLQLPRADYGLALRSGFLAAGGELVVNFDVDFVDLAFLDQAVALARADDIAVVIGSKRSPGARDDRGLGRRAVTSVFSALLRYGFGLRATDTHGLKLLRRAPLLPLVAACRSGADIFDTELVLRAERAGLRVEEIPVWVTEQRPPRTSVVTRIPRTLVGLFRLRLTLWNDAAARPSRRPSATPSPQRPAARPDGRPR